MLLIPSKIHAEKLWKAKKYDMNVNVKMSYEKGEADSRDTLYIATYPYDLFESQCQISKM